MNGAISPALPPREPGGAGGRGHGPAGEHVSCLANAHRPRCPRPGKPLFIRVHPWLAAGAGLAALAALPFPGLAVADRLDQDDARRLYRSGDILALERILEVVRGHQPGRVIEVELEEESRRYVYELEVLSPDGRVWELEVDAASGELLKREREE